MIKDYPKKKIVFSISEAIKDYFFYALLALFSISSILFVLSVLPQLNFIEKNNEAFYVLQELEPLREEEVYTLKETVATVNSDSMFFASFIEKAVYLDSKGNEETFDIDYIKNNITISSYPYKEFESLIKKENISESYIRNNYGNFKIDKQRIYFDKTIKEIKVDNNKYKTAFNRALKGGE